MRILKEKGVLSHKSTKEGLLVFASQNIQHKNSQTTQNYSLNWRVMVRCYILMCYGTELSQATKPCIWGGGKK